MTDIYKQCFFLSLIIFSISFMPKNPTKAVVFDLDETLGHFTQLGLICDMIDNAHAREHIPSPAFDSMMEMFSEYQRPGIVKILRYLVGKKHNGSCNMVMIYTNNQGPRGWAIKLQKYFEKKIGHAIFDRIIAAFKIDGRRVELKRTSHDKTVDDLISCTRIPNDTQICFIDDQHHPRMEHDNVYYIHIKPYVCTIPYQSISNRLNDSVMLDKLSPEGKDELLRSIEKLSRSYPADNVIRDADEVTVDAIVGKRVLHHIQEFFKMYGNRFTRRRSQVRSHRRNRATRKAASSLQ